MSKGVPRCVRVCESTSHPTTTTSLCQETDRTASCARSASNRKQTPLLRADVTKHDAYLTVMYFWVQCSVYGLTTILKRECGYQVR